MKNSMLFIFVLCAAIEISAMKRQDKNYFIQLNKNKWKKKKKTQQKRISSELLIKKDDVCNIIDTNNTKDIIIPGKQIVNNND